MTLHPAFFLLLAIGLGAGLLSGLFGVGGGVVIVPALIYLAGFDQRLATGTSLAVLLAPVGLGAVIEYYRQGNVAVPAAVVLAVSVMAGALAGAVIAPRILETYLRLSFGIFVLVLGVYLVWGAVRHLGWI
ncbi:MAG: TSUP family transporter [Acidobacteriota bacterium]|nr:TSUP family transporter [Acidobacteriota bacterium]